MSGVRLGLRRPLTAAANFRAVFAAGWTTLSPGQLLERELELPDGRIALGELCTASGVPDGTALVEGDLSQADWLGAGLTEGTVDVTGPIGNYAGAGMSGGALVIRGSAGHQLGGAEAGRKRGMTGGEIVVHGSVGDNAGSAMRRGLIAVRGDTGACAAFSILAGSVVCFGAFGADSGTFNKRGSLVSLGSIAPPPTYRYACTFAPGYLRLILARLRDRFGLPVTSAHLDGTYRRLSGDCAELGKGEILAWNAV